MIIMTHLSKTRNSSPIRITPPIMEVKTIQRGTGVGQSTKKFLRFDSCMVDRYRGIEH